MTARVLSRWTAVLCTLALGGGVAAVNARADAPEPRVAPRVRVQAAQAVQPGAASTARWTVRDPAPAPAADERWALVVGVTQYRGGRVADTIGGARDALRIRDVLVANGWRPDHIRVLVDDAATGAAVRTGLRWLVERSTPSSFSFFHYSGHTKRAGGRQLVWPTDHDFLSDVEIAASLRRLAGRAWLDFAACHAGGYDEGLASDRRLVTASSTVAEKSYEYPPWRMSVWTGLLFDQALGRLQGDVDRDGRVTIGEALEYARGAAAILTKDQPRFGYNVQHPYVAGSLPLDWTLDTPPTG